MFDDWKQAWREAVENFRRELSGTEAGGNVSAHVRAMRRDMAAVRGALGKLDGEITQARRDAATEREAEEVCRRREGLARNVGDQETVRLAAEYAVRHAERAVILERKVEVLEAERGLLARDIASMEEILSTQPESLASPPEPDALEQRERTNHDFGRLEREAREKAAAQRLEELKKKMR